MTYWKKKSVLPIYLVGVVWLVYALLFPLRTAGQYLICAALSAVAFVIGKALCPDAEVCSPSYSIVNEYRKDGKTVIYHVDAYRISDEDDLYSTGFYDFAEDPEATVAVEWSEKIPYALPENAIKVTIEKTGDSTRKITIERSGENS